MRQRIMVALLAFALAPAPAAAVGVGLGVYGGPSFPVVQDNAGNGGLLGVRVPVHLAPLFTVEPYFTQSALGDVEDTFGGQPYTRSGPDVTAFGANAIFGFGETVKFFPIVGIGSSTIQQSGSEDVTDTSLNFGLGLGFSPIERLGVDLRAELNAVLTGDTSRKFGNLTVGVSYALFQP